MSQEWRAVFVMLTAWLLLPACTKEPASGDAREAAADHRAESPPDARALLMEMATFLAGLDAFSATIQGGYDVVQESGQKIEFLETRKVTLERPNRLRIEETSADGRGQDVIFDGSKMTVWDGEDRVFAQADQPGSVDDAVVYFVRDLQMRLPLAPLLTTRFPTELERRVANHRLRRTDPCAGSARPSPRGTHQRHGFPGVDRGRRASVAAADRADVSRRGPAAILGAVFGLESATAGERQDFRISGAARCAPDCVRDTDPDVGRGCTAWRSGAAGGCTVTAKPWMKPVSLWAAAFCVLLQFQDISAQRSRPSGSASASHSGSFSKQGAASSGSFPGSGASAQSRSAAAQGSAASAQQSHQAAASGAQQSRQAAASSAQGTASASGAQQSRQAAASSAQGTTAANQQARQSTATSTQNTATANQQARQSTASSTTSTNQAARQESSATNQQARQSTATTTQSTATANQQTRQQTSTSNQESRQTAANQNAQTYSNAYTSGGGAYYYPPPPPPPYSGYYYQDSNDEAAALVTGLVVGAAVGSAAASSKQQAAAPAPAPAPTTTVINTAPAPAAPAPSSASLPCNPNVVNKNGVTYYQCGQTYYMQAYGSGGPIYMPVPPPP